MLPEEWKKEIEETIDKAARTADEGHRCTNEIQEKIVTRIDAVANALNKYNEKQERQEPGNRAQNRWTLIALAAAAVFTFGLDFLSGCQLKEMRKVYDPIQKSADATRDAADAAKQQVGVSVDTEQRQLRAYVGVVAPPDNQVAASPFTPPNIPIVVLSVKNFGQTPAYNAAPLSNLGIQPYPLPADFKFPLPVVHTPGSPITMFPGMLDIAGIYADANRTLTQEEYSSIQNEGKTTRLYVWGTVTYDDAFGAHHFTNYCLNFYVVSATKVQRGFCSTHNDSN